MMKALEWLNEQGGKQAAEIGDATALLAHIEKYHPITDELKDYVATNLPVQSLDLQVLRVLSVDDIIEASDGFDEAGFLLSLGYVVVGDHDAGVILFNANDGSVHVLNVDALDLSRAEQDEESGEYFWDGASMEDVSDDFEMAFEECSSQFGTFEEFDVTLTGVLQGEISNEELGIED